MVDGRCQNARIALMSFIEPRIPRHARQICSEKPERVTLIRYAVELKKERSRGAFWGQKTYGGTKVSRATGTEIASAESTLEILLPLSRTSLGHARPVTYEKAPYL